MKHRVWALTAAIMLSCLSAGFATAAADVKLPTWPQSFTVAPGDRVSFGIPVTQPGQVKVQVTWSGAPLCVSLAGPLDTETRLSTPQSGPVEITRTATAADVAKGIVWTLVISDPRKPMPKPDPALSVSGQVTAQYPAVDSAGLEKAFTAQQANSLALRAGQRDQSRQRAEIAFQAAMTKAEQEGKSRLALQAAQLTALIKADDAKLLGDRAKIVAQMRSSVKPIPAIKALAPQSNLSQGLNNTQRPGVLADKLHDRPELVKAPTLLNIDASSDYAGSEVFIAAKDLQTTDISQYEAVFTIGSNITGKGQITRLDTASANPVFHVIVPEEAPNMSADYTGQVVINRIDAASKAVLAGSNALLFRLRARLWPVINTVSPTTTSAGGLITIAGKNLTYDCETLFCFPDGHQLTTGVHDVSSGTRVSTTMPAYHSTTDIPVLMYVNDRISGRDWRSLVFELTCIATDADIAAVSPSLAKSGDMVYVNGDGMQQVTQLIFEPDPGKDALLFGDNTVGHGVRQRWARLAGSASGGTFLVPNATITGDVHGQLYGIYNNAYVSGAPEKRTNGIPFTWSPLMMEHRMYMPYYPQDSSFTIKDGGDGFSQIRTAYNLDAVGFPLIWICASHYSGLFSGHGGDDVYVANVQLKNGYHVKSIDWWDDGESGGHPYDAYMADQYTDSKGHPVFKVHWWVDAPCRSINYQFTPIVEGPVGVPYQ